LDNPRKHTTADYQAWPEVGRWEPSDGVPYSMNLAPLTVGLEVSIFPGLILKVDGSLLAFQSMDPV